MPPPAEPKWSQPVNGLRCGLSFDPERFKIGEQVCAALRFENIADEPVAFHHPLDGTAERFVLTNDGGQELRVQGVRASRSSRRRRKRKKSITIIEPGRTFDTQLECRVVAAANGDESVAGQFHAVYNLEMDEQALAGLKSDPNQVIWTGKIRSGKFTVSVTSPQQEGCIDCHGGADYHHVKVQECSNCHVGEVGAPDFDCHMSHGSRYPALLKNLHTH